MPKEKTRAIFLCQQCGAESLKWVGRCSECGAWNSLAESVQAVGKAARILSTGQAAGAQATAAQELAGVQTSDAPRLVTPLRELNRVLGGGLVPGSLVLIGGDPGIGKSTLMLQIADALAKAAGPVFYVSGEESAHQVRLRADRLGVAGHGLYFLAETELDRVLQTLEQASPALVIIDSIQTMYLGQVESVSGSVAQVRECTLRLMKWAKARNTPVIIAGHVTKEGAIAGPKLLEHMVDVVLYLEGESVSSYRVLRGVKNRFGSTNEVGIYEMRDKGLAEVANPSEALLAQRQRGAIGSAIVCTLEGTRPLMVEVQALVTPTAAPVPRRIANGVDFNRLLMICAIITKHLGMSLSGQDVLVNVTGGLRVTEPAADLAIAAAIVSSYREAPVRPGVVALGEIGLTGELRSVTQAERRFSEAASMGFRTVVLPHGAREAESAGLNVDLMPAHTLREGLRLALEPRSRPAMSGEPER